MVAKSFQNLEIVCEPYEASGRMYVKVKTAKGTLRQVRWYTEKEYAKYYGESAPADSKFIGADGCDHKSDPYFKTQKVVLGFKNGFITIFKGNTYENKEWFKEHGATYTRFWGWSISSEKEVPTELPEGIEAIRLDWALVGREDEETLKNEDAVTAAVESLIYDDNGSEFVGEVGDNLDLYVTIEKVVDMNGYYGDSTMFIMYDDCGNTFVWNTSSAKSWEVGDNIHLKGKVKEHKTYRNCKQTVLTRCRLA